MDKQSQIMVVHVKKILSGFNAYFEMYKGETIKDLKDAFIKRFPDDSIDKYKWVQKQNPLSDETKLTDLGDNPTINILYNDKVERKVEPPRTKKVIQTIKIPAKAFTHP